MPPAVAVHAAHVAMLQTQAWKAAAAELQADAGQRLSSASDLSSLQNAVPAKPNAWYHEMRAEQLATEGDKLICRMAFWSEIPLVGDRVVSALADKLENLTDRVERELELA